MVDYSGEERCWGYGSSGLYKSSNCRGPNANGYFIWKGKLGNSKKKISEVRKIVYGMESEFSSSDYSLMSHNCNYFTEALAKNLGVTYPGGAWMNWG